LSSYILTNFINRFSGASVDTIEKLRFKSTLKYQTSYQLQQTQLNKTKEEISHLLFKLIAKNKDNKERTNLIQLRRDIFNLKLNKLEKSINEITSLNKVNKHKIISIIDLYNKSETVKKSFRNSFNSEVVDIRNEFKNLLKNDDFKKGLIISSSSLYSAMDTYLKPISRKLNRKLEQTERGLLRYYSRMSMKATPFGAFCNIVPGRIVNANSNNGKYKTNFEFNGNLNEKESLILLNKEIFGILKEYILKQKDIRKELRLELNPTLEKFNETTFRFLTESESKEIFQRVSINPVLEYFIMVLEGNNEIMYSELVNMFVKADEVDADKEEIEEYLDKLIDIGFLRFRIGIPDQELNWDSLLINILQSIESPTTKNVIDFLSQLQQKVSYYSTSLIDERTKYLADLDELLKTYFKEFGIEKELRGDLTFYEDTTSDCYTTIPTEALNEIHVILDKYINFTQRLAYPRTDHITMRHFYDTHYKDYDGEVNLLRFYEDYYREHFKTHLEKQQKVQAKQKDEELKNYNVMNPFNIEIVDKILKAQKNIGDLIIEKWKSNLNAEEIKIDLSDIEKITNEIPGIDNFPFSASLFSQVVIKNNSCIELILPDGKFLLGNGKYFSRFLRLFTDEEQSELFEKNNELTDDHIAEINRDENFNANLHPPLTTWEIKYPTNEGGLTQKSIKCTDINIVADETDPYLLRLIYKPTGKYIIPLDLGFLNPNMRPPLFQLLSKFTPPSNFSLRIPDRPIKIKDNKNSEVKIDENNETDKSKEKIQDEAAMNKIVYRPRILLESSIILSRKSWIIPAALFPARDNNETEFEYFLRLTEWRQEYNIPDEVYVKINVLPSQPPKQEETESESKKDEEEKEQTVQKIDEKPEVKEETEDEKKTEGEEKTVEQKKARPKMSRDLYKPQYIDFNNPLLIGLFGKMTVNLKNYTVALEERYPLSDGLPEFNGERYSTEQIFQINFPVNNKQSNNLRIKERVNESGFK